MKIALTAFTAIALFAGCQKNLSVKEDAINGGLVSSDALTPLPCHSISYRTDYPVVAGQQPPFEFTKTLYPDTRVKTLHMVSRAVPNHPYYTKQVWETNGTFSYSTNKANFTGTKELWEYYKTSTGAGARRSLKKLPVALQFHFNELGHAYLVWNIANPSAPVTALKITYGNQYSPTALSWIRIGAGSTDPQRDIAPRSDIYGNPTQIFGTVFNNDHRTNSGVTYEYDYSIPRGNKNYSYVTSQNLISYEYNLLEVMQWIPQSTHQRKAVAGLFITPTDPLTVIKQSQVYKNHQFDAKGNLTSFTYADGVLQKTTWYCK
jgi:hypothetical protein